MKTSEMIEKLQEIKNEHGDLEIYEYTDWATVAKFKSSLTPRVAKIYSQKWEGYEHMQNQLSDGNLDENDEDLHDVDLNKPIVKGLLI